MNLKTYTTGLAALALTSICANAAVTVAGTTFDDFILPDAFNSGGTAGNTVRTTTPANFFSTTSSSTSDNLWRNGADRLDTYLGSGYAATIGISNDKLLEANSSESTPNLTTTITGLTAGTYDVYTVYIYRNDSTTISGISAAMSGNTLVNYNGSTAEIQDASGSNTLWDLAFQKVGTTSAGVTSIAVDIGQGSQTRGLYVGVAYIAVPEPSSTALLGLGGLALIFRRRK